MVPAVADDSQPAGQAAAEVDSAQGPLHRHEPSEKPDAQTTSEKQAEDKVEGEDGKPAKPTADELRQQMAALQKQLEEKRQQFRAQAIEKRQQDENEQRKKVEVITLPENPTRKQCEAYMAELREASKTRRGSTCSDPIVGKLKALPPEHYDLLMNEMSNSSSLLGYFANCALRGADLEAHREQFTASLDNNPNKIEVIIMNGWAADVPDVITEYVTNNKDKVTPSWFQAAVEVAGPEQYPLLHDVTINSRYANRFIEMLRVLPEYDLSHTINVCWQRAGKSEIPVSQSAFINLAVELGNIEALGMLISQISTSSSYLYSSSSYNTPRMSVLRYIDFRGSNAEIKAWFEKNEEKLVFDHLAKRFVLPEPFPDE